MIKGNLADLQTRPESASRSRRTRACGQNNLHEPMYGLGENELIQRDPVVVSRISPLVGREKIYSLYSYICVNMLMVSQTPPIMEENEQTREERSEGRRSEWE